MLTNKGANIAPEALDEKVDSLAKLIQNATKEDINKIKKAWFRWLYDFIKEKKDQVLWKRNEVIQQNKWVMISKESALAPLQEEISKAASVGDNSKVKSLQSIYNDVSWVFEKNWGQLPIEEAEKIKEAYYAKHKWRDKLESAWVSRADLETDVWYKKVWQWLKTAMEDATMSKWVAWKSPLTVWNQAYGTLADLEKTVAKTTTKAAKARTPSWLAVVFKGFNDTLKQIPWVRVATPKWPNIAPIAQEEAKLWGVLSDIRRWWNRVIKTSTAIDDDVAKAVNTVANTPWVKQVLGAWKKILKVAWPAMEAFGWFNPAQSIQDALNKWGAIVPSSGKLTPMKQA